MESLRSSRNFWLLAVLGGAITLVGLAAAHYMETHGHVVTGMGNEVVWGMPHVFAIFMIVADVLSRVIVPGQVLPIGVITALFGAPAFALILSQRRSAL